MTCISMALLIKMGIQQCEGNNRQFISVGFNSNRTTLVVQCNNVTFNMMNYFRDKDKCITF
jgi:hypothetical protein